MTHQVQTKQRAAVHEVMEIMAKEHMLFLMNRYHMGPEEMIDLYTGHRPEFATYEDALHTLLAYRSLKGFRS
ncbi:MAG: hypothetical protein B7X02_00645 [Rhodospirillales bacterium 12-54-5]|nr:MAG: hypothetical protein B7X02_00645 [Rhodospirillales bacterium 12-54-5]